MLGHLMSNLRYATRFSSFAASLSGAREGMSARKARESGLLRVLLWMSSKNALNVTS
jgi:hypothetical protein